MDFLINHTYLITFEINGRFLTFQCTILSIDDTFIEFIDKYGKRLSYNKSKIVSAEELVQ